MSINTMNRHDSKSEVMYIHSLNIHDLDPVEVMSIHSITRHDLCLKQIWRDSRQFFFMSIHYSNRHDPAKVMYVHMYEYT